MKRIAKAAGNKAATKEIVHELGKRVIRREARKQIERSIPRALRPRGTQVHHLLELFGHPGLKGVPAAERGLALFPTGGLPARIHSARMLLKPGLDPVAHNAYHVTTYYLERFAKQTYNRYTIGTRIGLNIRREFGGK